MFQRAWKVSDALPGRERDLAGQRGLAVVALARPPLLGPAGGAPSWVVTVLLGQRHDDALRLGAVVLVRAEVERPRLAGDDDLVVEPAELQLVPRAEVGGAGADARVARGAERGSGP